jgi:type I restriction enzyme S subunit
MRFELHEKDRYGLMYGDIVMCEGGEPGRCAIWKDQHPGMMIQKALHRIRPHDCLRPEFLFYYFLHQGRAGYFSSLFTGSTIKHFPREKLALVEVPVPPREVQERITDILSAYDDLIENNRRRIALLEESARMLYREWFIHLRFPGHEQVKVVDGVPEGWARKTFGCIAKISKGKNITKDTIQEGDVPVVAGGLKPAYYHNESNAAGPVVTISASGANAGYVALYQKNIWASDCSYLCSADNPCIWFIYLRLKSHQAEITGMQQGAAQPHVYPKDLKRLVVLEPPKTIIKSFCEIVEANFLQISNLEKHNLYLAQARDHLLPKLMSGEVEA